MIQILNHLNQNKRQLKIMDLQTENQNKKLHDVIIEAVALYFHITIDELKNGKSKKRVDAYKRHMCYYLIRQNDPLLGREFIADLFDVWPSNVEYGEKKIENAAVIYRRTLGEVADIQMLIDNFNTNSKNQLLQSASWRTPNSNTIH